MKRIFGIFSLLLVVAGVAVAFNNCAPTEETGDSASVLGDEFSGNADGEITVVEASGSVQGYALDPVNPTKAMRVHFYVDGPVGSGVYAGNVVASGTSFGAFSGHYYTFSLPVGFRNGVAHSLYAYGHEATSANILMNSPRTFTAFAPRAQSTYTGSGLGSYITNTCNGCHNWSYSTLFYSTLVVPSPTAGGTATNNKLINKISAAHGGNGAFCPTKSDFPCSAIQQWWNAEF